MQDPIIRISIPLKLFVELSINNFEGYIETQQKELVVELLAQDKEEQFIHIEDMPGLEVGRKVWLIWRRADWLVSQEKWIKSKAESHRRNEEWAKRKRNLDKLAKGISKVTGMDLEQAQQMAVNILHKKPQSAKAFDVILEE